MFTPSDDRAENTKHGFIAVLIAFLAVGVSGTPDGPFRRPHPAFWRLILCLSISYELVLVFAMFQKVDDARQLLSYLDPKLGKPLPEKDYAGSCIIYDSSRPDNPFHNVYDKFDVFVPIHFFGWWIKTLMLRDVWLCNLLSIMFEVFEYSLEHQLSNFSECWWDHWIMDAIICNGLGIYMGWMTLHYLSMKPYHWCGLWRNPRHRDKIRRVIGQFGPYVWIDINWGPKASLKRWFGVLAVATVVLLGQLSSFYMKFILWIPSDHILCLVRTLLFAAMGAVSVREVYQYLDDPNCHNFGKQALVASCIMITETLLIIKFDPVLVSKPPPRHMQLVWIGLIASLFIWTIWHFGFKRIRVSRISPEANGTNELPFPGNNTNVRFRRRRSVSLPRHQKA